MFDDINHDILHLKLHAYGIRGSAALLIQSYLQPRSQSVCINFSLSPLDTITTGVTQGSTLGPLLFMLYIDIINIMTSAKIIAYADDMTSFYWY